MMYRNGWVQPEYHYCRLRTALAISSDTRRDVKPLAKALLVLDGGGGLFFGSAAHSAIHGVHILRPSKQEGRCDGRSS